MSMSNIKPGMSTSLMLALACLCLSGAAGAATPACSFPAPGVTVCDFDGDGVPDGAQVLENPAGVHVLAQAIARPGVLLLGYALVTTQQSTPAGDASLGVGAVCVDSGGDGDCEDLFALVSASAAGAPVWVVVACAGGYADGSCDLAYLGAGTSAAGQGVEVFYLESDGSRFVCVYGATTPLGCGQLT